MSPCRIAAIAACVATFAWPAPASADIIVPANGVIVVNAGGLELACTDLIVAGTLAVGPGSVTNVRNFTIQPGGVVTATTGTVSVGGAFANQGTLAPPNAVVFGNACGLGPGIASIPVPATSGGGLLLLAALLGAAAFLSRRGLRS